MIAEILAWEIVATEMLLVLSLVVAVVGGEVLWRRWLLRLW